MKFIRNNCFQLLFIFLLFLFKVSFAQVTYTATFSNANLTISTISGQDGNSYAKIDYSGILKTKEIGKPELPVKLVYLIVPANQSSFTVSLGSVSKQSTTMTQKVYPAQYPIPTNGKSVEIGFVTPDTATYSSDIAYPSEIVKIVNEGYFDGSNHIITLAVCPMQYYPKLNKVDFYTSITLSLSPSTLKSGAVVKSGITKYVSTSQANYDRMLIGIVDNPSDISAYKATPSTLKLATTSSWEVPFYEYVIITSEQLVPEFQELASWKRRKGLNAGIVAIEDILSDPSATGDAVSNLNDDAGKLRQYLSIAYQNGTIYALLGGDYSIMPIRYGCGEDNTWDYNLGCTPQPCQDVIDYNAAKIPSDLYFSDFNGNWNLDGDKFLGEPTNDQVDYFPEIFIGRLLCRTPQDVQNYTYKLLKYEQNPGNGDYSYLTKSFMTQSDQLLDWHNEAYAVAGHFPFLISNIWNEEPSGSSPNPTGPVASAVVSEMNENYGLISLFGHGSPDNIAVATYKYNECDAIVLKQKVTNLDSNPGYCGVNQTGNGFDNLNNYNYPSIFYTVSCETMPFDLYKRSAGQINMAESFTTYTKAGGPAYLGNTRYGWIGLSYLLFEDFADYIVSGNYNIGKAEGISKSTFSDHWCNLSHNLVGDSEFEIWTAEPSVFDNVTITENGYNLIVNTGGIDNCHICVQSAMDNGASYYQKQTPSGSSATFLYYTKPYLVTITKHNFIPYIKNPDNIYVQNETISSEKYIYGKYFYAGSNVTPSKPQGPVYIQNGSSVVFDAENVVSIQGLFEVQPGALFEIK